MSHTEAGVHLLLGQYMRNGQPRHFTGLCVTKEAATPEKLDLRGIVIDPYDVATIVGVVEKRNRDQAAAEQPFTIWSFKKRYIGGIQEVFGYTIEYGMCPMVGGAGYDGNWTISDQDTGIAHCFLINGGEFVSLDGLEKWIQPKHRMFVRTVIDALLTSAEQWEMDMSAFGEWCKSISLPHPHSGALE